MCKHLMTIFKFYLKHSIWKFFHNSSFNFNYI